MSFVGPEAVCHPRLMKLPHKCLPFQQSVTSNPVSKSVLCLKWSWVRVRCEQVAEIADKSEACMQDFNGTERLDKRMNLEQFPSARPPSQTNQPVLYELPL